jgi:hypothetical protein
MLCNKNKRVINRVVNEGGPQCMHWAIVPCKPYGLSTDG